LYSGVVASDSGVGLLVPSPPADLFSFLDQACDNIQRGIRGPASLLELGYGHRLDRKCGETGMAFVVVLTVAYLNWTSSGSCLRHHSLTWHSLMMDVDVRKFWDQGRHLWQP